MLRANCACNIIIETDYLRICKFECRLYIKAENKKFDINVYNTLGRIVYGAGLYTMKFLFLLGSIFWQIEKACFKIDYEGKFLHDKKPCA